jgi:hypothetical protein
VVFGAWDLNLWQIKLRQKTHRGRLPLWVLILRLCRP